MDRCVDALISKVKEVKAYEASVAASEEFAAAAGHRLCLTKVISYGICSSEDVQAHRHCIETTRMGVNAIIHERAEKKERC